MKGSEKCLTFANREEWRAWLEKHHTTDQEAWLFHFKKKVDKHFLTYEEAVEEALCFGWIDGLLHSIDSDKYALRYSPRKPQSVWSATNKRRVENLISDGRMTAAGLEKIAEAKENGEWDAATAREDVTAIPTDLAQELKRNKALVSFNKWPTARKKQYLYWLSSARKPETRQKRVQAIVDLATTKD
jgi:uncharacterized protein YdeI (YjbR/CyaY-like superfamily)